MEGPAVPFRAAQTRSLVACASLNVVGPSVTLVEDLSIRRGGKAVGPWNPLARRRSGATGDQCAMASAVPLVLGVAGNVVRFREMPRGPDRQSGPPSGPCTTRASCCGRSPRRSPFASCRPVRHLADRGCFFAAAGQVVARDATWLGLWGLRRPAAGCMLPGGKICPGVETLYSTKMECGPHARCRDHRYGRSWDRSNGGGRRRWFSVSDARRYLRIRRM